MDNLNQEILQQHLIGIMIFDNTLIDDILSIVNENDFSENYKVIITQIIQMIENKAGDIDAISLSDKVSKSHSCFAKDNDTNIEIRKSIENKILTDLFTWTNNVPSKSLLMAKQYAEILKDKNYDNNINKLFIESTKKSFPSAIERSYYIEEGMQKLQDDTKITITDEDSSVNDAFLQIEKAFNKETKLQGLSVGYDSIDELTNGFKPGEFIIIAARPSVGKSMLALNIADNIATQRKLPVLFFSLEMPAVQLRQRSISRFSNIDCAKLLAGNLNQLNWNKLNLITDFIKSSKLYINDDSRLTVAKMRTISRQRKKDHGLYAIFVDYLSLIDGEGENQNIKIGNISKELKSLARDLEIPLICLAQLNRSIENRNDKTPNLSDLRDSGQIEQDADIVMFLSRDETDKSIASLNIAKNRMGKTGTIKLKACDNTLEFKDEWTM